MMPPTTLQNWLLYIIDDCGEEEYISALVNTAGEKLNSLSVSKEEKRDLIESAIVGLLNAHMIEVGYYSSHKDEFVMLPQDVIFPIKNHLLWDEKLNIWTWVGENFEELPPSFYLAEKGRDHLNIIGGTEWYKQPIVP